MRVRRLAVLFILALLATLLAIPGAQAKPPTEASIPETQGGRPPITA
jgi:hypothetical protein